MKGRLNIITPLDSFTGEIEVASDAVVRQFNLQGNSGNLPVGVRSNYDGHLVITCSVAGFKGIAFGFENLRSNNDQFSRGSTGRNEWLTSTAARFRRTT